MSAPGPGSLAIDVAGLSKSFGGKRVVDHIVLKLPILGILMQKIAVARFCRTLATLHAWWPMTLVVWGALELIAYAVDRRAGRS